MKFYLYTLYSINSKALAEPKKLSDDLRSVLFPQKPIFEDNKNICYFLSSITETNGELAAVFKKADANPMDLGILEQLNSVVEDIKVCEITSADFANFANIAESNLYIRSARMLKMALKLHPIFLNSGGFFAENPGYYESCAASGTRTLVEKNLKKALWYNSLKEELCRIYTPPVELLDIGHPVHYIFTGDNFERRSLAVKELISALYQNGRLKFKRYCEINIPDFDESDVENLESLYNFYVGGTIVIRYNNPPHISSQCMASSLDIIEKLCPIINKHKKDVLTILCFPKFCDSEMDVFSGQLSNATFIQLNEKPVSSKDAKKCLINKAKDNNLTADEDLLSQFDDERHYSLTEVDEAFEEWNYEKLKDRIYPQYKNIDKSDTQALEEAPKSNAYLKLQNMVGLDEVKKIIDSIINYTRLQKVFKGQKHFSARPSLNMCFTGNPGSAKTTVARLLAEILRDNGCLSRGHIVECGRADLVGAYVGQTAIKTKKRFDEARGGILFIDEAYSLIDYKEATFGDEAINTIVQEMENNRDDLIVIFAGYPDKMNDFLDKNPGLRSRISFHVPFSDYNPEELYSITEIIADDNELILSPDVKPKLLKTYESACRSDSYGNGRYVRNLIEKATLNQASRLVTKGIESLNKEELSTLTAEDFVIDSKAFQSSTSYKIGFC